jgi:hypothetical protein
MKMSDEHFKQYLANPHGADATVRGAFGIPSNRYYTVGIWPPHTAGFVRVNMSLTRVVKNAKISKSNQP